MEDRNICFFFFFLLNLRSYATICYPYATYARRWRRNFFFSKKLNISLTYSTYLLINDFSVFFFFFLLEYTYYHNSCGSLKENKSKSRIKRLLFSCVDNFRLHFSNIFLFLSLSLSLSLSSYFFFFLFCCYCCFCVCMFVCECVHMLSLLLLIKRKFIFCFSFQIIFL